MTTPAPTLVALVDSIINMAAQAEGASLSDLARMAMSARFIDDAVYHLQELINEEAGKHLPAGFQLHPDVPYLADDGELWTAEKWVGIDTSRSSRVDLVDQRGRVVRFESVKWWERSSNGAWCAISEPHEGPLYPVLWIGDEGVK